MIDEKQGDVKLPYVDWRFPVGPYAPDFGGAAGVGRSTVHGQYIFPPGIKKALYAEN
jgi:hypothetical protein